MLENDSLQWMKAAMTTNEKRHRTNASRAVLCSDAAHEFGVGRKVVGELHFWYHGCCEALCNVSLMEHTNTQYWMMQSKKQL